MAKNNTINSVKRSLLCIFWASFLSMVVLNPQKTYGQELPKIFVTDLSNMLRSVILSGKDSIDMYTVAVELLPNGEIGKTFFSIGTSENLKDIIKERLGLASIDHRPLKTYWKKYCIDNKISKPTIIIQTVLSRTNDTDNIKLDVTEFTKKYQQALTFTDLQWGNANVIWFPAKISRFDDSKFEH